MTKYGAKKKVIDGITFDSEAESKFYLYLKERKQLKEIKDFELQPRFELQPTFILDGVKYNKIEYVADFRIFNNDGTTTIIDVKGHETTDFLLKYKNYQFIYGSIEPIKLIAYSKIDGGWIELKDLKVNRKIRSKAKKVEKAQKLAEQQLRESRYMIEDHLEYVAYHVKNKLEGTVKFKGSLLKYIKQNFHTVDELINCHQEELPRNYGKKIIELVKIIKLEKNG